MPSPWQRVGSRVVYEQLPWLAVREEHVRLPNGVEIPDYVLAQERDVAMVVALTTDGMIPIVAQYKHGLGRTALDLPAGYLDDAEDPLAAAQRELVEETGLGGGRWRTLARLDMNGNRGTQALHLFLARDVAPVAPRALDVTEELDVRLLTPSALATLITDGEMTGLASVAAVLWALRALLTE